MQRLHIKKNVLSAVFAFSVNIALVFVGYRLLIKHSGMAALGLWSTLMAWIYMIRIGDVGMGSAVSRYVSMLDVSVDSLKIRNYIDTGLIFNVVFFSVVSAIGYVLLMWKLPYVVSSDHVDVARALLPKMVVGFFLTNVSGMIVGSLQGIHMGFISSRLGVCAALLQLLVVAICVPKDGLAGLAFGVIAQHSLIIVVGWVLAKKKLGAGPWLPICWSRSAHREMIIYSLKVQAVNLANGVFEPLAKIMMSRYSVAEVQGMFELAYKTVSLPRNAVMSGAQATLPATTGLLHSDPDGARRLYKKILRAVLISSSFVTVGVVIAAPLVSYVWTGHFSNIYWIFVTCLAVGFWFNSMGASAYNIGLAAGKIRGNLYSAIAALLILLSLGIVMGHAVGFLGVGMAVGVSLAVAGLYIKINNEKLLLG